MKPFGFLGVSLGLCAAWAALSCSSSSAPATGGTSSPPTTNVVTMEAFGMPHTGDATFYTFADGSGACLYDKNTADVNIAALNASDWDGSAWCGACADVTTADGSKMVRVRIVDECPD